MYSAARIVLPEFLDALDPLDPRALRARADLRRVHRAMRSLSILAKALGGLDSNARPRKVLELGAGDASLLLRYARTRPDWRGVALTVLDRHDLISAAVRRGYERIGWRVHVLREDVVEWATRDDGPGAGDRERYDLCLANLFLHHFDEPTLKILMAAIAARSDAFVACEPRRNRFAWCASRLVGVLGANAITRHDAVASVQAGFADRELSALWPHAQADWRCHEYVAPPFTHVFSAVRRTRGGDRGGHA